MGWVRISDDFYDNDKVVAAGSAAIALYVTSIAYCNRNLTDGMFPRNRIRGIADYEGLSIITATVGDFAACSDDDLYPYLVDRLLGNGLWHEQGHGCNRCVDPPVTHYVVHDYLEYQRSKELIEAEAARNRERVRKHRDRSNALHEPLHEVAADKTPVGPSSNALGNGVSNAVVQMPQPQPQQEQLLTLGAEVALVGGSGGNAAIAKRNRGQRLSENWMPDLPVVSAMRDEFPGITDLWLRGEHRKFIDYWIAQAGSKGVKLDWNATWRNWIRRAMESHKGTQNGTVLVGADAKAAAWQALKGDFHD